MIVDRLFHKGIAWTEHVPSATGLIQGARGLAGASVRAVNETRETTRVLFIAYEYPPVGGAGVRRSLLLSQHLGEFGIAPVVLTTDLASFQRDKEDLVDLQLLEKIPHGLAVERIPTRPPLIPFRGKLGFWTKSMFVLTDTFASRWQPELMKRLPDLIARYKPKAIYATLPPFSMARLACSLGQKTGLPVLLDFRDAWSQSGLVAAYQLGPLPSLVAD